MKQEPLDEWLGLGLRLCLYLMVLYSVIIIIIVEHTYHKAVQRSLQLALVVLPLMEILIVLWYIHTARTGNVTLCNNYMIMNEIGFSRSPPSQKTLMIIFTDNVSV